LNLLFVTSTRVGDAVLSTGLLDRLIAGHPGLRVTVACGRPAASLFAAVPGLERVLTMDKHLGIAHWVRLWLATVARRWDIVVDLRGSALAWLLRADERHVWHRPGSEAHRVVQIGGLLGLVEPPAPRVWLDPMHRDAARRAIPDGAPVLALGPTTSWPYKQWPLERFAALAERLTAHDGVLPDGRIAVFGAPDEHAAAAPLLERLPHARTIDAVGLGDLLTVAAALQRCSLFVGNDSGLMHLAAASGVPTLGLFGPSDDLLYAPWGPRGAVARTTIGAAALHAMWRADRSALTQLMDTLDVDRAYDTAVVLARRCGLSSTSAVAASRVARQGSA
jgi:ADP-heptose:LPS heptosyltransferase